MYSIPVLAAFFGGLAMVKAAGDNTCTTTVTSVIAHAARSSITSEIGALIITPLPNSSGAASTVGSILSSVSSSLVSSAAASESGFSEIPHPTISSLTGSALSSQQASIASVIEQSSYPYNFTFGPGGGIYPSNGTTLTSTLLSSTATESETTTSTSSAEETTSTETASTAAAESSATTSPEASSGGVAEVVQPKGAELALAVVAAVMLFL
ncbi:MAG: hypothetical protein Q9210_001931 [Variospora velana]